MKKPRCFLFCFLLSATSVFAQADSSQAQPPFFTLRVKDLEAKSVDKSIQLRWSVTGNEDAKNFEVERADDGVNFRKIGGRLAQAHQAAAAYEFVDALPRRDVLFTYRIRINGKDGTTTYSEQQTVKVGEELLQCRLKQNPVRNNIELEINSSAALQLSATVLTAYGQKVVTETARLLAGVNSVTLSSQNLQAGIHRLVLEAGNERKVISFVKE